MSIAFGNQHREYVLAPRVYINTERRIMNSWEVKQDRRGPSSYYYGKEGLYDY